MLKRFPRGRNDFARGKGDLAHGKDGLAHGKDDLAHRKNDLAHGKDDLGHGKNDLAHGKDDFGHGKNGLADGKNGLVYGKNDLAHGENGFSCRKNDFARTGKRCPIKPFTSTCKPLDLQFLLVQTNQAYGCRYFLLHCPPSGTNFHLCRSRELSLRVLVLVCKGAEQSRRRPRKRMCEG